jgi:hypothetical protein
MRGVVACRVGLVVGAVLALDGCQGGTASEPRAPQPAISTQSADDGCEELAVATCRRVSACMPFVLAAGWGTERSCVERSKRGCTATSSLPGVANAAKKNRAYAARLASVSCEQFEGSSPGTALNDDAGTLNQGDPCRHNLQCATSYCQRAPGAACGHCAFRAKEGDSCIEADQCGPGNVCSLCSVTANSATCLSARNKGDACRCSSECGSNLQCSDGVCATTGRKGDACSDAHPCDAWGGLLCGGSGVCEQYRLVAAGEACDVLEGSVCSGGNGCVQGRCVAQEAAPCTSDRDCLPSQICAEGLCVEATGCD